MANVLEIEDLTVHIKLRHGDLCAVDDVSLRVAAGETLGLVGESGCGKTMTGLSVLKLFPPGGGIRAGRIWLNGRDLVPLGETEMRRVRGKEVAVIFQDPMTSLNPTMNIGNQLAEALRLHHPTASDRAARDRSLDVLDLVGMPAPRERVNDFPHQLSGGLRQRVLIAMALVCEPSLLIADEPTTALDVTLQAQILDLLDGLRQRLGMSILLITHDMGIIAGRADRVAVMYAGKIVEEAETRTLFKRTRHRYTEALIQAIPRFDEEVSGELYSIPGLPPDLVSPPGGCRFSPRCRYATAVCFEQPPELLQQDPLHFCACHHPAATEPPTVAGHSSAGGVR